MSKTDLASLARRIRRAQSVKEEGEDQGPPNYRVWRARRESIAAQLAEIRYHEEVSKYVDAGAVREALAMATALLRAYKGPMVDRLVADVIAAGSDESARRAAFDAGIYRELNGMADALEGLAARNRLRD